MIKLSVTLLIVTSINLSAQKIDFQDVNFLTGTWKVDGKESYETWTQEKDQLNGYSYKIENGQKKVTESLIIKVVDDDMVYIATVFDQNKAQGVPFKLNYLEKNHLSFENPGHDFPKKIQYKLINDLEIVVQVLGENDEGYSFKMSRHAH